MCRGGVGLCLGIAGRGGEGADIGPVGIGVSRRDRGALIIYDYLLNK